MMYLQGVESQHLSTLQNSALSRENQKTSNIKFFLFSIFKHSRSKKKKLDQKANRKKKMVGQAVKSWKECVLTIKEAPATRGCDTPSRALPLIITPF
jgi:hypothetical protein